MMRLIVTAYVGNQIKTLEVTLEDEPVPTMGDLIDAINQHLSSEVPAAHPDTYVVENRGEGVAGKRQVSLEDPEVRGQFLSELGIQENSSILAYRNPQNALVEALEALEAKEVERLLSYQPSEGSPVPALDAKVLNNLRLQNGQLLIFKLVQDVALPVSFSILQTLLRAGADPGVRDAEASTPLALLLKNCLQYKIVTDQDKQFAQALIAKMSLADLGQVQQEFLRASLSKLEPRHRTAFKEILNAIETSMKGLKEAKAVSPFFASGPAPAAAAAASTGSTQQQPSPAQSNQKGCCVVM